MKRQVPGLAETVNDSRSGIPDGIFLVRVDGAQFHWQFASVFAVQLEFVVRNKFRSAFTLAEVI